MTNADTDHREPIPRPLRRIFVSSTSIDLHAHRHLVIETLSSMDQSAIAMEFFGARGAGDAQAVSRDEVDIADAFILIVAWRYGYVPAGAEHSITHQEYIRARERGLPIYVFMAADSTEQDRADTALFPLSVRDDIDSSKLMAFRSELKTNHVAAFFTTPEDLARKVATSLHRYLQELLANVLARHDKAPDQTLSSKPTPDLETIIEDQGHRVRNGGFGVFRKFNLEFDQPRWAPLSHRVVMQLLPIDTPNDLLPFGTRVPGQESLDKRVIHIARSALWIIYDDYHIVRAPHGLSVLAHLVNRAINETPVSLIYFDRSGGVYVDAATRSVGCTNPQTEACKNEEIASSLCKVVASVVDVTISVLSGYCW